MFPLQTGVSAKFHLQKLAPRKHQRDEGFDERMICKGPHILSDRGFKAPLHQLPHNRLEFHIFLSFFLAYAQRQAATLLELLPVLLCRSPKEKAICASRWPFMSISPMSPSPPTTTPSCNRKTLRCAAHQVKPKAVWSYRSSWGRRGNITLYHFSVLSRERRQWGEAIGYSGLRHQEVERGLARIDNHGYVLSPLPVAPVNEVDRGLLPQGLKDFKRVARHGGLDFTGAVLSLDTGLDSKATRKRVFNAGLKPNLKENPRNRQTPKWGRKRFFDNVLDKLRFAVDRPFAWEDKFKRLLLCFETKQRRHLGFTLINLRGFCGG